MMNKRDMEKLRDDVRWIKDRMEDREVARCVICGLLGFAREMAGMVVKSGWWGEHTLAHPQCLPGTDYDRRKEER